MAAVKDLLLSHFYITLDGVPATGELAADLVRLDVESSLHLPDVATLVVNDPALKWVDGDRLEPGKALRIESKDRTADSLLFDGEVVEIESEFNQHTHRLIIRAYDRLHRLARGRHARAFHGMNDGDIVRQIAGEVGLTAVVEGPTLPRHDYILQANQSNLEFLQGRATAAGRLIYVEEKSLYFCPPQPRKATVSVRWNDTLSEFRPRLSTVGQVDRVEVRGWDPVRKASVSGRAEGRQPINPQVGEQRDGGTLSRQAFSVPATLLVTDRPVRSQSAAEALARAVAGARAGRFLEAEGHGTGNPAITAGNRVNVTNVGDRFSGEYFVTEARHIYDPETGYATEFVVSGFEAPGLLGLLGGRGASGSAEAFGANGALRHGLGVSLAVGIVMDNNDPDGLGRVKVRFPWLSESQPSFWARLATPGGGAERGWQCIPEIEDEVLVGFDLGNMEHAFVLGGLWNGQDRAARATAEVVKGGKVEQRLFQSRTGHLLLFNDSDDAPGVHIRDRNGNVIELQTTNDLCHIQVRGDCQIVAQKNVTIQAGEKIRLDSRDIELNARNAIRLHGMTISLTGTGGNSVTLQGTTVSVSGTPIQMNQGN